MGDATEIAQSDPWFRTTSPEQAIQLCETSYYPHWLKLLGPSHGFGLTQRVTCVGPITVGDITYETDVALGFDESRASYHVCVPLEGWLESRHRGQQLTSTPRLASVYRPDAEMTATRWPGGSRHLAVKIDQVAVDRALETLLDGSVDSPIPFNASLPLKAGAAQDWVRLVLMAHRQLDGPDSLMRHAVVWEPLVESLIHGLLLVAEHPYRQALAAPSEPGRPAAVRDAMDIIEGGPHLPLTISTLARQCHVSVRTLQEGFQRHLGMSPMAYVRVVRLRRAHRDLRSADPCHSTVSSIAHRWGFTHLGRFAAAHKTMYGQTPLQALRAAH
jgi:AraC-like DNA-binding protein